MEANIPDPNATPTPQASQQVLADAKAKFEALLASRRGPAPEEPKAEEAAPEEAKKEEPAKEAAPAPAPEPVKAKSPEVEKLRNKLLLAGNPKRAVESLDDEEVAEWWKRQEERERTAALALQRASDLERQLKEATDTEPEEPQGVPTSDQSDLNAIAASLSDQFGEDEAKAIVSVLKAVIDPIRKENEAIKAVIQEAQKNGRAQLEQRNRDRLAKDLPALKESGAAWNAIQREAQERFAKEPSKYASPDEAYSEAFQELYGAVLPAKSAATDEPDTGKAKARIAASSHTAPSSQKGTKKITPVDAARAAFVHLTKNPGDTDGARRTYGQLLA